MPIHWIRTTTRTTELRTMAGDRAVFCKNVRGTTLHKGIIVDRERQTKRDRQKDRKGGDQGIIVGRERQRERETGKQTDTDRQTKGERKLPQTCTPFLSSSISSAICVCDFLLVGWVSVSCDRLRQKSWSPRSVSCVAARKIVRRQSWDLSAIYGYSLVVDEDVQKPNKQSLPRNLIAFRSFQVDGEKSSLCSCTFFWFLNEKDTSSRQWMRVSLGAR